MKHVWAYHRRTGRKRRIPESWLLPNVFGGNWSLTPRSRGYTKPRPVEPEPSPTGDGTTNAPADGDTRKDK